MAVNIFGAAELDQTEATALVRQNLRNLITSYADEADVFTELIQNAIDAVALRLAEDRSMSGRITVVLGRRDNASHYVYVQDNGVGMSRAVVHRFAAPGFSLGKERGRTIGYKGVGASYFAGVSNRLAVRSVAEDGETTEVTVRHAHDWIVDDESPEPLVDETFDVPDLVRRLGADIERGTGVFYQFHSGHQPRDLNNIVIVTDGADNEVRYWASYLAARTPVGSVLADGQDSDVTPISVRIILDRGDEQSESTFQRSSYRPDQGTIGYPLPRLVFRAGKDISDIDALRHGDQRREEGRNQAVWHRWTGDEIIDDTQTLDEDQVDALRDKLVFVDGYLAWSTNVWKEVRRLMGARSNFVRYGIRLAVDGIPQGRPIELTLTSNQGLERQSHIVVAFDRLELDIGRKFISDERLLDAVSKIGNRVVTILKEYREYLKRPDLPDIASDLEGWRQEVASRAAVATVPRLLEISGFAKLYDVDPASENEVISLWSTLLALGVVKGYRTSAISGFNTYDSLTHVDSEATLSDLSDPLSVVSSDYPVRESAVLEFKLDFESVVDDFRNRDKNPAEIDLLVCWSCRSLNLPMGKLMPTYGEWSHERQVHSASYVWRDNLGDREIQVIALENVVAELLSSNDGGDGGPGPHLQILQERDRRQLV